LKETGSGRGEGVRRKEWECLKETGGRRGKKVKMGRAMGEGVRNENG
jgi:hypothetical protein